MMMNKLAKRTLAALLTTAMAVTVFAAPATEVSAYDGVSSIYNNKTVYSDGCISYSKTTRDANGISIPNKVKIYVGSTSYIDWSALSSSYYTDGTYVQYDSNFRLPEGAQVTKVKSNKSNLKCNIYQNAYTALPYMKSKTTANLQTGATTLSTSSGTTSNSYPVIGLYAKKSGTYKLTISIALKNGTTVNKTVTVKAVKEGEGIDVLYGGYTYSNKDQSIVKTTSKSGKLTVKAYGDYKVTKIEFANSFDSRTGDPKYKKIKNKKTVSLNTKKKTRNIYSETETYDSYVWHTTSYIDEDGNTLYNSHSTEDTTTPKIESKTTTITTYQSPKVYNYLFPVSYVRISYKDKWTGLVYDVDDANGDGRFAQEIPLYYIK